MQGGSVKNITIIGGGSAGWMTAAYLSKKNPDIHITLIEASDVPVIGVGEATIAHLSRFLFTLGLKDKDWMPHCNGAYKYGIKFDNWHNIGDEYWHPFEALPYYNSKTNLATYWWYDRYKYNRKSSRESLYTDCFFSTEILKQNKIPRVPGAQDYSDNFNVKAGQDHVPVRVAYAYHFDAGLFGEYLKNHLAKPAGVDHIIDNITDIERAEDGNISALNTKNGLTLEADLFIDCSGFRSVLIGAALDEKFISFSDTLFCNKAMAMQIPYENIETELQPYTTASAISHGWVWNTPLTSRRGTGYVYCDNFVDQDTAEQDYRAFLGEKRVEAFDVRHIDIRVGKYKNTWVKNCVAIGLSSGFIEPLESTGLHFIHVAVEKLSVALEGGFYNAGDRLAFNRYMTLSMEEARDMLSIHYSLTNREDTDFWKAVKYDTKMSDSIADLLMLSKHRFPNDKQGYIFGNNSWICVLNGMNYMPSSDPFLNIQPAEVQKQMGLIKAYTALRKKVGHQFPNHYEYLTKQFFK
ncbi:Tryptophan halogenase [hydrothermal vent metagenome]|uniref:Tryptophan halogenase n=1 Tax=hydrothermal vent metagenome TaxID=652676 RepID=A0A3B0Z0I7_9ZZZZ